MDRVATAGAALDTLDVYGRTAAHVAAFASRDEVLRALAKASADMNALGRQACDVVTIAVVADDPKLMSLAKALGNDSRLTTNLIVVRR